MARQDRWIEMHADGVVDRAQGERGSRAVAEELEGLDDRTRAVQVPPAVYWTWEPQALPAVLAALWSAIPLDAEMRPAVAVWRIPGWRAS